VHIGSTTSDSNKHITNTSETVKSYIEHTPRWRTGTWFILGCKDISHTIYPKWFFDAMTSVRIANIFIFSSWSLFIGLIFVVAASVAGWFLSPKNESRTYVWNLRFNITRELINAASGEPQLSSLLFPVTWCGVRFQSSILSLSFSTWNARINSRWKWIKLTHSQQSSSSLNWILSFRPSALIFVLGEYPIKRHTSDFALCFCLGSLLSRFIYFGPGFASFLCSAFHACIMYHVQFRI